MCETHQPLLPVPLAQHPVPHPYPFVQDLNADRLSLSRTSLIFCQSRVESSYAEANADD